MSTKLLERRNVCKFVSYYVCKDVCKDLNMYVCKSIIMHVGDYAYM